VKFVGVKIRKERPSEWGLHALQRSLAGFANWILGDRPYLTPAHETLPVLAAVEAIYCSATTGRRENIEI
jgi:predicted dehydrogenase